MTDTGHKCCKPRFVAAIVAIAVIAVIVAIAVFCARDYRNIHEIFLDPGHFIKCIFMISAVVFYVLLVPYLISRVIYWLLRKIRKWLDKDPPKNSAQPKKSRSRRIFKTMREMNWISKAEPKGWLKMPKLKPVPIAIKKHGYMVWMHSVRTWKLTKNWKYTIRESSTGKNEEVEIVIPKGFVFDGASVPRPLWAILHPSGLLLIPALVHDFAYRYGFLWQVVKEKTNGKNGTVRMYRYRRGCKEDWDRLFKEIGDKVNGVNGVNWVAWLAVYAFGRSAWNKNDETRKKANCRERLACQCRPPDGYDMEQSNMEQSNMEQSNMEQSDCQMNDRPENGGNDLPKPK